MPAPGVILVADSVPLLRQGLVWVLTTQAAVGYGVHEVTTGAELLTLVPRLEPVLVLTAANLPGTPSGAPELLQALRAIRPQLPVVVLTDPATTPELGLLRLLRQNVSGLLPRSSSIMDVCEVVGGVLQRGRHYHDYVLALLQCQLGRRSKPAGPRPVFSDRQVQVLQLIAEDYSNEEIADYLATSVRTVEYHRSQMLQKTGTRTTLGLVLFALRQGVFADKGLGAAPVPV
jgi:DNA-binding NarL/FixJ family response regulator